MDNFCFVEKILLQLNFIPIVKTKWLKYLASPEIILKEIFLAQIAPSKAHILAIEKLDEMLF